MPGATRKSDVQLLLSLLVGIAVAAAAIGITVVLAPPPPPIDILPPDSQGPRIELDRLEGPSFVAIVVMSASPAYPLARFAATATHDDVEVGIIPTLFDGASDGILTFLDQDGDGTLSGGDRFILDSLALGVWSLTVLYLGSHLSGYTWGR